MGRNSTVTPIFKNISKRFKTAERSELINYFNHSKAMNNEWLRRQIIDNNRIDILAKHILGYEVHPLHFAMLQFQFAKSDTLQLAFRGAGKSLGLRTKILMADGTIKNVENVEVGDQVMGPDSKPRNVLGLGRGKDNLYKIIPKKGEPWVCNSTHILTLMGRGPYKGQIRDFSLKEFVSLASNYKRGWADIPWKQFRVGVDLPEKKLPIDPYFFGLWLGDGNSNGEPLITNGDDEIYNWVVNKFDGTNGYQVTDCKISKEKNCKRIYIKTKGVQKNPLKDFLVSLGGKHIPSVFLLNSRENRLKLLAGLLDIDGYYDKKKKYYEITQKSKELAEQIAFLARSLGFAAYINKKIATIKDIDFEGEYWRVTISGDLLEIPCIVERKKPTKRECLKDVLTVGFSIEKNGYGDYYGFQLDGDGRFLLGDFTVTHNSTCCTVTKAVHYLLKNPNLRILIPSKSMSNSQGFLKEIKGHFESNEKLAEVFGLYYDPRRVNRWNESEIEVLPRTKNYKEASVTCVSVEGTIVSKHYDVILSDDLIDEDNSRTQYIRDKIKTWYYQTLEPTLEPPDSEVEHRGEHHRLGTRYHYADLYGHLIENELKENHQIIPALKNNKSAWPEKYTAEWFSKKRKKSGIIIFNCHSEDTEFLTKDGWFKFKEIPENVELATFNTKTNELEFQAPNHRFCEYYEGELLRLKNRGIDALVTPNHRFWTKPNCNDENEWGFFEALNLKNVRNGDTGRIEFLSSCLWNGCKKSFIKIKGEKRKNAAKNPVDTNNNRKRIKDTYKRELEKSKDLKLPMDLFLEFLGYFISEGHTTDPENNRGSITFSQKSGEYSKRMIEVIESMGFKCWVNENHLPYVHFGFANMGLWNWLKENCGIGSKNKKIPRFVFDLDCDSIKILLNSLVNGDGCWNDKGSENSFWYTTTSKQLIDDLHEIALRIGLIFTSTERKVKDKKINWNRQWTGYGHFYNKTTILPKEQIKPEPYKGNIVCFSVLNETLITKLNGRVLLSGNCQYQNDTEAMKGEIFQYDDCQKINTSDIPDSLRIFMGIDLAISQEDSADHFAIAVIGVDSNKNYYVLDWFDGHLRFGQQTQKIIQFYNKWDPIRACIEINGYQAAQYQHLKDGNKDIRLKPKHQDKDKISRAWKMSSIFEDKRMFFKKVGSVDLLIEQLVLFPNHRYKDFFDALSLAMTASKLRKRRKRMMEPGII